MKIFDFSCMLVTDFTVITLLRYICRAVINGENHVKSHPKGFEFCNIRYSKENL